MYDYYKCLDCGHVFDEDEAGSDREWIGEDRYESNSSGWMYYMACPECGSTEIVEAERCDECGDYFDKTDLIRVGDMKLCQECARDYFEAYWEKWGYIEKTDLDRAIRVIQLNTTPNASGYKNLQRVNERSVFKRGEEMGLSEETIITALKEMGFKQVYNDFLRKTVWEKGGQNSGSI